MARLLFAAMLLSWTTLLLLFCQTVSAFSTKPQIMVVKTKWPMLVKHQPITLFTAESNQDAGSHDDDDVEKDGFFKGALEGAVKEITGETDYELGELGDQEPKMNDPYTYQFGDITKSILAELRRNKNETKVDERVPTVRQFADWRSSLHEKDLPIELLESFYSRLDKKQRINLILVGCQLAAEGVVLWGLVANLCTLLTAALSWTFSLNQALAMGNAVIPLLPISIEKEVWRSFTAKFMGVYLLLSPFFLIIKAVTTLVGFRKYHSFVVSLSNSRWIAGGRWKRYKSTVLNRAIAVVAAFFINNVIASALAAGAMFTTIGLLFRLVQP